jgi:hypothetical protein
MCSVQIKSSLCNNGRQDAGVGDCNIFLYLILKEFQATYGSSGVLNCCHISRVHRYMQNFLPEDHKFSGAGFFEGASSSLPQFCLLL